MKDHRACFAPALDKDSNWSDYLRICKELKQKIREKRKTCRAEFMDNVNSNYRKNIRAFWKFVNGLIKSTVTNRTETLIDGSGNRFSSF